MATPRIDIGIMTIRDDEFDAVLESFPAKLLEGYFKGQRDYTLRQADAGGDKVYNLAILKQVEQGNGEAQDAARDLLEDLKPSLLLVVGIAGGLPSEDYSLGDVVLSTRINDYSVEARQVATEPTYNLSGGPIDKKITSGIANLRGRLDDLGDWTADLGPRPPVTWQGRGRLYGPPSWRKRLKESLKHHFGPNATPRPPTFVTGPIASSDRLVKDPTLLFPWIETARHLLAVEMESGGVYRAARTRQRPMLAIRALSDIVGLRRKDAWTKFACRSAAAFARAYLMTTPVAPKRARTERRGSSGTKKNGVRRDDEAGTSDRPTLPIYSNLLPLKAYPKTLFVAPALCKSQKQAWAVLLRSPSGPIPRAWAYHGKYLYSLFDPSRSEFERIADIMALEEHDSEDWAQSDDPDRRRLFTWLLNGALIDDMWQRRIHYFWRDRVFFFPGRLDEPPRRIRYRNVQQRSEITVVQHYPREPQAGDHRYLRHNAVSAHFRRLESWVVEVTPTYLFTDDGKKKNRFHQQRLSKIKRIERNRAVLSQTLLWLRQLQEESPEHYLYFDKEIVFETEQDN